MDTQSVQIEVRGAKKGNGEAEQKAAGCMVILPHYICCKVRVHETSAKRRETLGCIELHGAVGAQGAQRF